MFSSLSSDKRGDASVAKTPQSGKSTGTDQSECGKFVSEFSSSEGSQKQEKQNSLRMKLNVNAKEFVPTPK